MSKKKIIILSIIFILLIICMYISISYGYYVISSNQKVEMQIATSTPSCIGLTIANVDAFTMDKDYSVPITDSQFLNSKPETRNKFKYSFTIKNDCTSSKTLNIGIAPLDGSDLPITKLKYILVESTASNSISQEAIKSFSDTQPKTLGEDIKKYLKKTLNSSATSLYDISSVTLTNMGTKTYDLYIWVSSGAENDVMDKTFSAAVVLDDIS